MLLETCALWTKEMAARAHTSKLKEHMNFGAPLSTLAERKTLTLYPALVASEVVPAANKISDSIFVACVQRFELVFNLWLVHLRNHWPLTILAAPTNNPECRILHAYLLILSHRISNCRATYLYQLHTFETFQRYRAPEGQKQARRHRVNADSCRSHCGFPHSQGQRGKRDPINTLLTPEKVRSCTQPASSTAQSCVRPCDKYIPSDIMSYHVLSCEVICVVLYWNCRLGLASATSQQGDQDQKLGLQRSDQMEIKVFSEYSNPFLLRLNPPYY